MSTAAPYSRPEELAHSLTAGLGIVACAVAIPMLVWVSLPDPWRLVTGLVFGFSALAMFVTSVIYHAASNPSLKLVLRKLDHSAIYLLIAGTYTPFTLVAMPGAWGWPVTSNFCDAAHSSGVHSGAGHHWPSRAGQDA